MGRLSQFTTAFAIVLLLGGCTAAPLPNFVHYGPPLSQAELNADSAACRLYSSQYVSGYGWAVRDDLYRRVITDCMIAKGYAAN